MQLKIGAPLILALASLAHLATAKIPGQVLESETKQLAVENSPQFGFSCSPGVPVNRPYPTTSSLIFNDLGNPFPTTRLNYLVHEDVLTNLGNHCEELKRDFLAHLPATLTVTRSVTQTCWNDDSSGTKQAHKILWQSLAGTIAGYDFGSGDEILSDTFENGSCQ